MVPRWRRGTGQPRVAPRRARLLGILRRARQLGLIDAEADLEAD